MNDNIFKGLITALITPFKDQSLDLLSLEKLIHNQIISSVDCLLLGGSTGEGTSLELEEYKLLLSNAIKVSSNRIPIIASCSSFSTNNTLKLIKFINNLNINGIMCGIPPYIKPSQNGIIAHFEAIHNSTNLPIMLYSVPSRTGLDFTDDTIITLSKLKNIIALKDAGTDLERPMRLKKIVKNEFNFLSGNDETNLFYNMYGGAGCISVASNVMPKLCKIFQDNCTSKKYDAALMNYYELAPLYKILFLESNPIPVKYIISKIGLCKNEFRLPLTPLSKENEYKINDIIKLYVRI